MLHLFSKLSIEEKSLTSSLVNVWEKDPSVKDIGDKGIATLLLTGKIQDGPKTKQINMIGVPTLKADDNRNFLVNPEKDIKSFDTVHTFSYVHRTLTMYRRVLNNLGKTEVLNWQWGPEAISVYPDAGVLENAYYSRKEKCLKFFHFEDSSQNTIYTCRAQDIVAHETGHAILDAMCPGFMESYLPQTGGLHESFGDITSMFVLLNDLHVCEEVILKSKCDLHKKDLFLPDMANQFGNAIGRHGGLRNANNHLSLSDVGQEVHGLSQVFTGAIYDILADMFRAALNTDKEIPSATLYKTASELQSILVNALIHCPKKNASYADVANQMIALAPLTSTKAFIKNQFESREVNLKSKLTDIPLEEIEKANFKGCSGTLRSEDYQARREEAIKTRKAEIEYSNSRSYYSPMRWAGY